MEYQRGSKAMTIPAHNFPTCRDVLVKCIKFVLPEDLDISGGSTQVMCNPAASRPGSSPTTSTATSAAVSLS